MTWRGYKESSVAVEHFNGLKPMLFGLQRGGWRDKMFKNIDFYRSCMDGCLRQCDWISAPLGILGTWSDPGTRGIVSKCGRRK